MARQSKKPLSYAARFKNKKINKPKAEQETAQPIRLRGLIRKARESFLKDLARTLHVT